MAAALLEQPVVRSLHAAELRVQTDDIVFHNVAPGRVRLSVTVANIGELPSQPTLMTVQAAPLGAFVPWKDVTTLAVPSIGPHDRATVTTELSAPLPAKALGDFSRVPPRKLLTAIAAGDSGGAPPAKNMGTTIAQALARMLGAPKAGETQLPDDPLQLLSRPNPHWAGNINILIGRHAVERHLAQALRIYPGRTNLAVLFVGNRRDEYQFELTGSGAAWEAALFDCTNCTPLAAASPAPALPLSKWIRMDRLRSILLSIYPPEHCDRGSIEVHVCQRSTRKDALVEFSLDPRAAGAGCYTV